MCAILFLVGVAFLLGLLATGIALIIHATAGVAVGVGLVTFVVIVIVGIIILALNPDLIV